MLFRFSLYGFLKNQQYFEPFLVLVFLSKGLSFFQIGLLVAIRELTVNLLEVPSGALADVWGRRRCMIGSFAAYMVSFVLLGLAGSMWLLAPAMALYGVGEAFRTGTHKAMIFSWLRAQGREAERTRIYGLTRSWSKIGSAVATVVGALIVLATDAYEVIFYAAAVPYALGVINFLGYPAELDGERSGSSARAVFAHLVDTLRQMWRRPGLRRLVFESMGFEGTFKVARDYLQPLLQAAAVVWLGGLALGQGLGDAQRTALLVGPVYVALYLLSAAASRHAHRLAERAGSEDRAAGWLWGLGAALFIGLVPALWFDLRLAAIVGFALLFVLQNAWRPILISRFDLHGEERQGATVLSVENQAKSLATMLLAPILGAIVDAVRSAGLGGAEGFWPVAATGALVAIGFFVTSSRTRVAPRP